MMDEILRILSVGFGPLALVLFMLSALLFVLQKNKYNRSFNEYKQEREFIDGQVTELLNRLRQSEVRKRQLQNRNDTLEKVFKIISHDLITPYNSLLNYTTLLKTNFHDLSESDRTKFFDKVCKSAKTSFRLTSDLLDWMKSLATGTSMSIMMKSEVVQVFRMIKESIAYVDSIACEKDIQIRYDHTDETCEISLNPQVLKVILYNLLVNAIKFTERGGNITVRMKTTSSEVTIYIQDSGIGFQRSSANKGTSYGTENEEGSGLGLLIVEDLAHQIGAMIQYESNSKKGTQAILTIKRT